MGKRLSPREQRVRRRARDERAFLFDSELNLIAEFEREDRGEGSMGRSADEARSTYRLIQEYPQVA